MSAAVVPARIRGKVGQASDEEDPAIRGKWFVEVSIWDISGKKEIATPYTFGPWDTKAEAEPHCKELCNIAAEFMTELMTGMLPDLMIDMKTGEEIPYTPKAKPKPKNKDMN